MPSRKRWVCCWVVVARMAAATFAPLSGAGNNQLRGLQHIASLIAGKGGAIGECVTSSFISRGSFFNESFDRLCSLAQSVLITIERDMLPHDALQRALDAGGNAGGAGSSRWQRLDSAPRAREDLNCFRPACRSACLGDGGG